MLRRPIQNRQYAGPGLEICNYNQLLLCNINGLVPFCRLMDQSVDSAPFFFPFFLVLNCMFNSLDFFVFSISLSLYFPLALSLRMSFLFYGSLSEGYIPALCRLMPTRTSKIIITSMCIHVHRIAFVHLASRSNLTVV